MTLGQDNLLERVPKLQATAAKSNGGGLGCGIGTLRIVTSKGELTISSGLDAIHVFGTKIAVKDLLFLLEARVRANLGETNPMSGHVSDLGYVILDTLSLSNDLTVIPVISKLLEDKDDVIRGWSAIALFRLADSGSDLRQMIAKISFPKLALQSASSRGIKAPEWVTIRE